MASSSLSEKLQLKTVPVYICVPPLVKKACKKWSISKVETFQDVLFSPFEMISEFQPSSGSPQHLTFVFFVRHYKKRLLGEQE